MANDFWTFRCCWTAYGKFVFVWTMVSRAGWIIRHWSDSGGGGGGCRGRREVCREMISSVWDYLKLWCLLKEMIKMLNDKMCLIVNLLFKARFHLNVLSIFEKMLKRERDITKRGINEIVDTRQTWLMIDTIILIKDSQIGGLTKIRFNNI